MDVTSRSDVSPSCDPAFGSGCETAALTSQTHGSDVVCEGDGAIQLQQGDVVVVGVFIIIVVTDDRRNTSGNLIGIGAVLSLFPQIHHQVTRIRVAAERKKHFPAFDLLSVYYYIQK